VCMLRVCNMCEMMKACRHDTFFHFPVAHALLYGVLRDFWKLMLRKPGDTVDLGDEIRVSTAAQKEMQELFATLKVTSSFSSSAKDITKCATFEDFASSWHALMSVGWYVVGFNTYCPWCTHTGRCVQLAPIPFSHAQGPQLNDNVRLDCVLGHSVTISVVRASLSSCGHEDVGAIEACPVVLCSLLGWPAHRGKLAASQE